MKDLTSEDFDKQILTSPNLVVVDFHAKWCGPCKMIAPFLDKLDQFYESVDFFKVDIDENPELSERFNISSVPTFKFIRKGKVTKTQVGLSSPQDLEGMIRTSLDQDN